MKLRNLMYATMIACAFASCSKDDEVINNGGETAKGDVTLDVQTAKTLTTKAYGSDDATITTLGVYVFGSDSKLEGYEISAQGKTAADNSRKVSQLTAGTKTVLVLANYQPTVTLKSTTAAELYALVKSYDETSTKLSMNSKIYEGVTLQAGKVNYLGYNDVTEGDAAHIALDLAGAPVYLYRNVGKVVLSSIKVEADNDKYPNANLDVEQVFILHAVASSKAAGNGTAWGPTMPSDATFLNGVSSTDYNAWKTTLVTLSKTSTFTLKQDTLASGYADAAYADFSNAYTLNIANGNTSADNTFTPFYPYENTNAKAKATLLVVKGKFNYTGVTGKSRYYSVAIGYDNVADWNSVLPTAGVARTPYNGLYRNVQYNISLTVAGPGYETPFGPDQKDNTYLDVKVQVVPFGTVNQSPVIE